MTETVSENSEVTVLLVDDNPQNLKVLYETLKDKGYRLLIANEGEKALDLAHRHHPEVILLDIMMPGATGLEVLEKIRQMDERKSTPVVILTAKGQDADRQAAFSLGANDFLTKPFSPKKLLARIHQIIEGD